MLGLAASLVIACGIAGPTATGRAVTDRERVGPGAGTSLDSLALQFNALNTRIRDGRISKPEALRQFQSIISRLRGAYIRVRSNPPSQEWIFPVEGYSSRAIGGRRGEGYVASGYDYFAGNAHGGHAAHDIFIHDRDQDCRDDRSGRPVRVLSVSSGIVVAAEEVWEQSSQLRGGRYLWIFDPESNGLFYYAHNDTLLVGIGQVVRAGTPIATVGRTGLNAFKKRSPTHLHITQLRLGRGDLPSAVNPYADLLRARSK
jgi:hypothetical protein